MQNQHFKNKSQLKIEESHFADVMKKPKPNIYIDLYNSKKKKAYTEHEKNK